MKIAITSQGADTNAIIDPRFGRCAYFAIYDTESGECQFFENPNLNSDQGAGPASVGFIANHGVSKAVAGEFGFKIKEMLDGLNIQMIIMKEAKTIADIIELIKGTSKN